MSHFLFKNRERMDVNKSLKQQDNCIEQILSYLKLANVILTCYSY